MNTNGLRSWKCRGEMMRKMFEYERERKQEDLERYQRTGIESYEQTLDRWREDWRKEIDDDLDNGR